MFMIGKTRIFTIGTKVLSVLLWVGIAVVPLACLTINKGPDHPPPSQSRTDVNVGGDNGVDVKHSDSGKDVTVGGDKGVVVQHSDSGTEVKVGGDHGVVVDHPNNQ
jgi:hypothetical protein